MSNIKIYQGNEIKSELVRKSIKRIHKSRLFETNRLFSEETLKYDYQDNSFCVLGSDWYLIFSVNENFVDIDVLYSQKDKDKLIQTKEMITVFKELFLAYRDYMFFALLNENSYRLFEIAVTNGLIEVKHLNKYKYPGYKEYGFVISPKFFEKYDNKNNRSFVITPIENDKK